MSVQYMSFSAHADAKGIMQLISQCEPRNVLLVHGEAAKMDFLKNKIKQEFKTEIDRPPARHCVSLDWRNTSSASPPPSTSRKTALRQKQPTKSISSSNQKSATLMPNTPPMAPSRCRTQFSSKFRVMKKANLS
ncbi:hypothetical protein ScPMuIL_005181 [Solemya velum]